MTPEQHDLFAPRKPAANRDPLSSHRAAKALQDTGTLKAKGLRTLHALATWLDAHDGEPPTTREMAAGNLRLRYEYARRMSELREAGLVEQCPERPCRDSGRLAVTWSLTPEGRAAVRRMNP